MMKCKLVACMAAALVAGGVVLHTAMALPAQGKDSLAIPGAQIVTGTVSYLERMELPQTAMVHVELIDIAQKDPRKAVLGEDTIWPAGIKPPFTFRIAYDSSRFDPSHTYIVRARIMDGEKTLFVSSSISPVLTKGAPGKVDIVMVPFLVRY